MRVSGTYLCQIFGIMSLSMVCDSAQIVFKQEKQRADSRKYIQLQNVQEAQLWLGDRATRKHAKDS